MRTSTNTLIAALVIACCAFLAQVSSAAEINMASPGQADLLNDSGLGQAVSNENLGELSGRQEMFINNLEAQISSSDQKGQANANSILNSTMYNGANSISDNAFANASGLVTVIQNSGNQVLIQNDLIMNLTVK